MNESHIIVGFRDHTTDPDRPFIGQPHTDQGERVGKQNWQGFDSAT